MSLSSKPKKEQVPEWASQRGCPRVDVTEPKPCLAFPGQDLLMLLKQLVVRHWFLLGLNLTTERVTGDESTHPSQGIPRSTRQARPVTAKPLPVENNALEMWPEMVQKAETW